MTLDSKTPPRILFQTVWHESKAVLQSRIQDPVLFTGAGIGYSRIPDLQPMVTGISESFKNAFILSQLALIFF